jgi:hypothetical protein
MLEIQNAIADGIVEHDVVFLQQAALRTLKRQ